MISNSPEYCWLFVYGVLQPPLKPPVTMIEYIEDRIRGLLFDLGDYPAAIEIGRTDRRISGYSVQVASIEVEEQLDPFEAVDRGVYRRIRTRTDAGREVWVYEYARTLPGDARGPLESWPAR